MVSTSKRDPRCWTELGFALLGAVLVAGVIQAAEPAAQPALQEVEGAQEAQGGPEDLKAPHSIEALDADQIDGDTAAVPSSGISPELREERRRRQVERNLASVHRNIWWNRPRVIGSLELDERQRRSMDRILDGYLRSVLSEPESTSASAFRRALADGDLEAAQRHLDAVGEQSRQQGMAEGEMMLRVLDQLTETQRAALRRQHGPLLLRSWVKLVSNSRGRAAAHRRGGAAQNGSGGGSSPGGGG